MKQYLIYIAMVLLLFGIIFNSVNNHQADHDHQEFFQDVREFMNKGGRNTAEDGARRDKDIAFLKKELEELKNERSNITSIN